MPSTCVVPNCLTNRSGGTKGSCFQVPKNESLRKKWVIAIPGINTLRYQFVCYKHFEKKAIVTSYTKYDASGNILLKINYQRPKLQTGAVPSIFDNSLKVINQLPPKKIYEIYHSYALSDNLDVRTAVSGDSSDSNIGVTPIESDTTETIQDNIASECHVNFTEKESECLLKNRPANSITLLREYSCKDYKHLISKDVNIFIFKQVSFSNFPFTNSTRYIFSTKICSAKSKDKVKEKKKPKQVKVDLKDSTDIFDVDDFISDMNEAVENMKNDFIKHLTVRSTSGSLEQIPVKFDGKNYQIQELAQIARKPKLVVLNVAAFPTAIPFIIKAIEKSGLNINPQQEGTTVYLPIPKVTKEHRENLSKNAKAIFIQHRDEIKEIKNKTIKSIKKRTSISEDTARRVQTQIETICNNYIKEAETVLRIKQDELLGSSD